MSAAKSGYQANSQERDDVHFIVGYNTNLCPDGRYVRQPGQPEYNLGWGGAKADHVAHWEAARGGPCGRSSVTE